MLPANEVGRVLMFGVAAAESACPWTVTVAARSSSVTIISAATALTASRIYTNPRDVTAASRCVRLTGARIRERAHTVRAVALR